MVKIKSRVGAKGQVVIPKPIRDALGIHVGDEVFFDVEEGRATVDTGDPERWLEEFIAGVPPGTVPADIDWDDLLDTRFDEMGEA